MWLKKVVDLFVLGVCFVSATLLAFGQEPPKPTPTPEPLPKADIANGKYGEFAANTFDLWKADSKKPTPLVVYIHGGGLLRGDKNMLSANQLNKLLEA